MRVPAADLDLHGASLAFAAALGVYLVLGQPLVSGWNARRVRLHPRHHALRVFGRTFGGGPLSARMARYHRSMVIEWSLAAVALAIIAGSGELRLAHIGVRWPALDGGSAPYTVVGSICLTLSVVGIAALGRRTRAAHTALHGSPAIVGVLPRGARERRAFIVLALTAGVCEELLYRGVVLVVAAAVLPGLSPARAIIVAAAVFGLAHAYQGAAGMLVNFVLGACFAVLFLGTASLLLPILFHVLIDLRVLILPVDAPRPAPPDAGPRGPARQRHALAARRV